MRKLFLATLALLCTGTGAFAQYNSRIQLELDNFGSPQARGGMQLFNTAYNSIGFSFSHSIYKNIGFKLSHTRWETFGELKNGVGFPGRRGVENDVDMNTAPMGSITSRYWYHMVELSPTYSRRFGRHEVFAAAGLSFARGSVDVLTHRPSGDGWDCIPPTSQYTLMNLGAVPEAGYNIHYLRCMSTGLSATARYYNKQFSTYTLQLNIGYNFNSFK